MASNASSSSSSQARRSGSLFAFGFTPTATSSPVGRSSATPGPSQSSTNSDGARSQSLQAEDSASRARSTSAKPAKGSRPGRVAQPGAGLAVLRRMATAPAALPAEQSHHPVPSSSTRLSEARPTQPSAPELAPLTEMQDAEQTPKRAKDLDRSSLTPRGPSASSPSGRLAATRKSPLEARVTPQPSSSTLTSEPVGDLESESSQQRPIQDQSANAALESIGPRLQTPNGHSDENEVDVSSRSGSSAATSRSTSARKTRTQSNGPSSPIRERSSTSRNPSPFPSANRILRSASKPPTAAHPPCATPTRSSARLRSQSAEPSQPAPPLAFLAPTSSLNAQHSTMREHSDTSAPGFALSDASTLPAPSKTPRSRRTAIRSPSVVPPSPDSHEAATQNPVPVTPQGSQDRTRFLRDPSGSPLSDLAPSPVKLTTTTTARGTANGDHRTKSKTWKPHAFELVVEVPASRWRSMRAGSMRREREGPTSEYTDRPSVEAEELRIKREDQDEDEDETMSMGDLGTDEEDERSMKTSPTRRPTLNRARRTKRKSSASSSSEEEGEEEEEEEEEEDVMAALARARARVAAGQTLAPAMTSPGESGVSTAPTTASSAHAAHHDKEDDYVRRSSRARHQTDRFSPTAVVSGSARGGLAPKVDVKGKGKAKNDGDRSFERMMREMQAQQKKGRGQDWYEAQRRLISKSDDDLDENSGASDVDDLPDLNVDDSQRLTTLAQGIAGAVSEDDLLSPDKLAHKRRAREVASFLGDEQKKKAKAGKAEETPEERQARSVWEDAHRYDPFDMEAVQGEGWLGRIASAIKDGLKNPQHFPSSITLMSRLDPSSVGSGEDWKAAAKWLFSLACHPDAPPPLFEKLSNLFHRIAQYASRIRASSISPLLGGEEIVQHLVNLGADSFKLLGKEAEIEATHDEEEDDLMELEPVDARPTPRSRRPKKPLSADARIAAVERWCRLVQIASSPRSLALNESEIALIVEACVKLSLDPTSAILRGPLERTLISLLDAASGLNSTAQFDIFRRLALAYRPSRPHTQVELLRTLPHRSSFHKSIRKWLAWAYLASNEAFERVMNDQESLSRSHLPLLLDLVTAPPPSSAFNPPANSTDSSNDVKLFQQATLLLLSLTDLDDQLNVRADKVEAQGLVDEITTGVIKIDSKLRADVRKGLLVERIQAKNLLTSITNSLDYQLRRSRGQLAKFDITQVDEIQADENDGHKDKKVKVEIEETKGEQADAGPSAAVGA